MRSRKRWRDLIQVRAEVDPDSDLAVRSEKESRFDVHFIMKENKTLSRSACAEREGRFGKLRRSDKDGSSDETRVNPARFIIGITFVRN